MRACLQGVYVVCVLVCMSVCVHACIQSKRRIGEGGVFSKAGATNILNSVIQKTSD